MAKQHLLVTALALLCAGPCAAATVSWTGTSSFWDLATNWSSNPALPAAGDDGTIDVAGIRTITVRATGGPFFINSLSLPGDDILAIAGGALTVVGGFTNNAATSFSSGSLTLNGLSNMAQLTQTGGVLGGTGLLTVTGAATLSGTHSGIGVSVLQGASTVNGLNLDAGRVLRNQGTVTLTGGMNLNPADNSGAGRIDNAIGALFDVRTFNLSISASAFADLNALPGHPAFNNAGTLRKSTAGTYGIGVALYNTGLVEVLAGGFSLTAGGTQAAASSISVTSGGVLTFAGGTHVMNGGSVSGAGTVGLSAGVLDIAALQTIGSGFTHSGGTLQGTDLTLSGAATLAGSGVQSGVATTLLRGATAISGLGLDAGRTLRNEGTVTLTGGINLNPLDNTGAGRIDNAAGALFDVRTFNTSISAGAFADLNTLPGYAVFNNAGTFRKSSSGGYGVAVPFNNRGTIDIQAGSFSFSAGSSQGGAATLAAGTALTLSAGSHDFMAGASFSGPGTLTVSGAATVVNINAPSFVDSSFSMSGGTLQGGDLTLRGTSTLAVSASLGVMAGAGRTVLQGETTIANFGFDAGRVLRNEATTSVVGSIGLNRTSAAGSGRIDNAASAVFNVATSGHSINALNNGVADNGLDAAVNNAGIFSKSTSNDYGVSVSFNNAASGLVDVQQGSFSFTGGGSHAGAVTLAAGTALAFGGGTHAVNAGASFSGEGRFTVSGATTVVYFNTPTTIDSAFSQTGGTIDGSDLTLLGATAFGISSSLGFMTGPATTLLRGATVFGGPNAFSLDAGRVLRNEGNAVLAGSIQLNRTSVPLSGRIENAESGVIDVQTFNLAIVAANNGPLDSGAGARFNNAGLLKKTTAGNYTIAVPFFNTGTVSVLAGTLTFSGGFSGQTGRLVVGAGTTLSATGTLRNQGVVQGSGTVSAGLVTNQGRVSPGQSPGTLTLAADYEQLGDGTLDIELESLASFDTLTVTGTAALAGTLTVSPFGGYTPVVGDSFVILSSTGPLSGTFDSSPALLGFDSGVAFDVRYDYGMKTVTLAVTAVPEPDARWLLLAGLAAVGWTARRRAASAA